MEVGLQNHRLKRELRDAHEAHNVARASLDEAKWTLSVINTYARALPTDGKRVAQIRRDLLKILESDR